MALKANNTCTQTERRFKTHVRSQQNERGRDICARGGLMRFRLVNCANRITQLIRSAHEQANTVQDAAMFHHIVQNMTLEFKLIDKLVIYLKV